MPDEVPHRSDQPLTGDDPKFLILDALDNVAIVRTRIRKLEPVAISGVLVTFADELPLGHKVARKVIAPGEKILKLGVSIGRATTRIELGEHVHTHNVASDYIPTYLLPEDAP
ncbi:MAG: hydrolase [Mesorhizobium sp.]|uniref:UxaA family hydrolase n=1 Tax=Mesorhizobium sp. TaxID=1871066 RepID=UPI000FE72DF1|nr:UxaA family hydrolase [Mesorhizobium sp.]RWE22878.1 MAG: hydrolase [Mesorhizobium sp.]